MKPKAKERKLEPKNTTSRKEPSIDVEREEYTEAFEALAMPVQQAVDRNLVTVTDNDVKRLAKIPKRDQVKLVGLARQEKYKSLRHAIDAFTKQTTSPRSGPKNQDVEVKPPPVLKKLRTKLSPSASPVEKLRTYMDETYIVMAKSIDEYHRMVPSQQHKRRMHALMKQIYAEMAAWQKLEVPDEYNTQF